MRTKDIKQEIEVKAPAKEVYEAFMDQKKHSKIINSSAKIEREIGGKFELYNGDIIGETLELLPNTKIVQKWRYNYEDWPEDHFSEIILELVEKDKNTCVIKFEHNGIPEKYTDEISKGWYEYYWNPLKALLEK